MSSSTIPFQIVQSGKPYFFCEYCVCYYSEECFYKNCISRKQRTCSPCYDKFKHRSEALDSTNKPDDYYKHLLNRLRNCYFTACKGNRIKDELTFQIIKCVMEAWNYKSFFSGDSKDLSLERFDLSDNGLLEPDNLVIYTKEEKRRRVHQRIWKVIELGIDKNVINIINEDMTNYRKRLRVILNRENLLC